jgi:hypothetical protein
MIITWQTVLIQVAGTWLIGNALIMVFLLKKHLNELDRLHKGGWR